MMYLFKSEDHSNRLLYAYYKNEFWFFDPHARQWYISGHVREQYELEAQKDVSLTPDDFTCTGYGYEFVAEYEVPVSVLDALRNARKMFPKEEPVPGQDKADAPAEAEPSAANPAAPENTENPTPAAPASRVDAGAAAQSLSAAGPASLAAEDMNVPAFDFGADAETNAALLQDAQIFMSGSMARVMAAKRAHDRTANNYRGSWGKWCDLVGISRDTGDNMVRVAENFGNMELDGKPLIETAPFSLLAVAAKPSAPAELVKAVKDGDITTHKQYQDLLARYNAEKAAREKAEQERDEAATHIQAARDMQIDTARERDAALRRATEAEKQRDGARDALAASKLRGDKLKAENDALKAHPIEAQVVDEEEINRRAQARAAELTAPLREELEALRNRHPADPEEAEQAIRDAYDSAIYTSRTIENAWHSLRPLLSCMDSERRVMAVRQLEKILTKTQEELRKCL